MSHDHGHVCLCRADHRPAPLELNKHHIWPQEYGGPSVEANYAWICPTTHVNVHELLREIVRREGVLPWSEALALWEQPLNRYAFDLAHEGYRRMQGGMP